MSSSRVQRNASGGALVWSTFQFHLWFRNILASCSTGYEIYHAHKCQNANNLTFMSTVRHPVSLQSWALAFIDSLNAP